MDGDVLYPEERTTQGDPLAIPFNALATVSLIKKLTAPVTQVWYADDAATFGKISDLRAWWDQVSSLDPSFGYFPNATKTWLVTNKRFNLIGTKMFSDTALNVIADGRPHLGAPIGTAEFMERFIVDKVDNWISEVNTLSSIAMSQPHAAYSCFTHGFISRWLHVAHTVPGTFSCFLKLEEALTNKFIPALTDHDPPTALQHSLFTLPTRFGGLGIISPDSFNSLSSSEFSASLSVMVSLRSLVLSQDFNYSADADSFQVSKRSNI